MNITIFNQIDIEHDNNDHYGIDNLVNFALFKQHGNISTPTEKKAEWDKRKVIEFTQNLFSLCEQPYVMFLSASCLQ